jgi:hypothetical protein
MSDTVNPPPVTEPVQSESGSELAEPPNIEPETVSMPKDAFNKRLEQAQSAAVAKFLRDNGYDSTDAFTASQQAAAEQAKAAEEAKRAEMSEIEKYKTDLAAAQAKQAEMESALADQQKRAEALEMRNHLHNLCRERGIQNVEYAMFKISQAVDGLEDDAELNEVEYLDQLCADEAQKAALGLSVALPENRQATTTPPKSGPDPKPNQNEPPFDAMTATPEELAKRAQDLGFHH